MYSLITSPATGLVASVTVDNETLIVGVESLVILSVFDGPVSEVVTKPKAVGAAAAVLSVEVTVSAVLVVASALPAISTK